MWGPCLMQVLPAVCLVVLSLLVIMPCQFVCYVINFVAVWWPFFVSYCLNVVLDKRFKIVCSRWSCKCLCNVICVCVCVQEYVCVYKNMCVCLCTHKHTHTRTYFQTRCNEVNAIFCVVQLLYLRQQVIDQDIVLGDLY